MASQANGDPADASVRVYVPLDGDGRPDAGRAPVQIMQHQPGRTGELLAWAGGVEILVNGGPAVVLPGKGGVVGLGDFAARRGNRFVLESADGFATRWIPADELPDGDEDEQV